MLIVAIIRQVSRVIPIKFIFREMFCTFVRRLVDYFADSVVYRFIFCVVEGRLDGKFMGLNAENLPEAGFLFNIIAAHQAT